MYHFSPVTSCVYIHRRDGGSGVGFSLNSSRTSQNVTEIGIREVFVISYSNIYRSNSSLWSSCALLKQLFLTTVSDATHTDKPYLARPGLFTAFIFRDIVTIVFFKLNLKQVNKTGNFCAVDLITHRDTNFH